MIPLPKTLAERSLLACARIQEVAQQLAPLVAPELLVTVEALAFNAAALREKLHAAGVVPLIEGDDKLLPFYSGPTGLDRFLE